ncbi:MAG: peptide ABC transporter substrate-binding protein, partial [Planctomycetes bacterium]|nr:peptide ABC transporter substrate-binding protein [Planctomycetota bacterium]
LEIRFATTAGDAESQAWLRFIRKQFAKLNIRLVPEVTDYNRFQDKVLSGNFQFLRWGWVADYPDPENFLFLLYGPNGKVASKGENVSNYRNAEYDRLFEQMENMENSPRRLELIRQMVAVARRDAPWIFGYFPVRYGLYHHWLKNAYPNAMAYNTAKYLRIDVPARSAYRRAHNAPRYWPIAVFLAVLAALAVPAVRSAARHLRQQ